MMIGWGDEDNEMSAMEILIVNGIMMIENEIMIEGMKNGNRHGNVCVC